MNQLVDYLCEYNFCIPARQFSGVSIFHIAFQMPHSVSTVIHLTSRISEIKLCATSHDSEYRGQEPSDSELYILSINTLALQVGVHGCHCR
jgi:hypothetical protein